jgi:hypothetical protein
VVGGSIPPSEDQYEVPVIDPAKLAPHVGEIAKRKRAEAIKELPVIARFAAAPFLAAILAALAPLFTRLITDLLTRLLGQLGDEPENLMRSTAIDRDVAAYLRENPDLVDEVSA